MDNLLKQRIADWLTRNQAQDTIDDENPKEKSTRQSPTRRLSPKLDRSHAAETKHIQVFAEAGTNRLSPRNQIVEVAAATIGKNEPNEDAHFVFETPNHVVLGCFDGVGGWDKISHVISNKFAQYCYDIAKKKPKLSAMQILDLGFEKIKKDTSITGGSTTACIVKLDKKGARFYLNAAYVGDSGFAIMRNGKYLYKSEEQQHEWNQPLQLSSLPQHSDTMEDAVVVEPFELNKNDIVLVATDGLFDNLYAKHVCSVFNKENNSSLKDQVKKLVKKARKVSLSDNVKIPFNAEAKKYGHIFTEGKVDDITALTARIL